MNNISPVIGSTMGGYFVSCRRSPVLPREAGARRSIIDSVRSMMISRSPIASTAFLLHFSLGRERDRGYTSDALGSTGDKSFFAHLMMSKSPPLCTDGIRLSNGASSNKVQGNSIKLSSSAHAYAFIACESPTLLSRPVLLATPSWAWMTSNMGSGPVRFCELTRCSHS